MKRVWRKPFCLLMAILFSIGGITPELTQAMASAAEEEAYWIYVGGVGISVRSDGVMQCTGELPEGVSLETGDIVLRDAKVAGDIYCEDGLLSIIVEGDNSTGPIVANSGLKISGGGNLAIRSHEGCIISHNTTEICDVGLALDCRKNTDAAAFLASGEVVFKNVRGAFLRQMGPGQGIFIGPGSLVMENCDLFIQGCGNEYGIHIDTGSVPTEEILLTIWDSRLECTSDNDGLGMNGGAFVNSSQVIVRTTNPNPEGPAFSADALVAVNSTLDFIHADDDSLGYAMEVVSMMRLYNSTVNCKGYSDITGITFEESKINVVSDQSDRAGIIVNDSLHGTTIDDCTINIANPSGDGLTMMGSGQITNTSIAIQALGAGITACSDFSFGHSDLNIEAGEIALNGGQYSKLTISGCQMQATGKAGIYSKYGAVSLMGGDITLNATQTALLVDSFSSNPDDAIALSKNTISDAPISCEIQDNHVLYGFGEDIHFDWAEMGDGAEYTRFDKTSNAEKDVHIYGNGAFEGCIDSDRYNLPVGTLANFTATWSSGADHVLLSFEIPENLELASDTISLNGSVINAEVQDRMLSFETNQMDGAAHFSAYVMQEGPCEIKGSAVLEQDGKQTLATFDSCALTLENFNMNLPTATGRDDIIVSGTTIPGSTLTFYDNDSLAGKAEANMSGNYIATLHLSGTRENHAISAKIHTPDDRQLAVPAQNLRYAANQPEADKLVIRNIVHGREIDDLMEAACVLDFTQPSAALPRCDFYPDYPTLFFELSFTNCKDPLGMGQVSLITTNHSGEETEVPLSFDADREVWIGSYDYTEFTIPERITVVSTGDNYGTIICPYEDENGQIELACMPMADGSMAIGFGETLIVVKQDKDGVSISSVDGSEYSLQVEDEDTWRTNKNGIETLIQKTDEGIVYESEGKTSILTTTAEGSRLTFDKAYIGCNEDMSKISFVDGEGHATKYSLSNQRVSNITYADGSYKEYLYDDKGNIIRHISKGGMVTDFLCDEQGVVMSATREGRAIYSREEEGNTLRISDADNNTAQLEYDDVDRLVRIVYSDTIEVNIEYDANGNISAILDPFGGAVRYGYDTRGQLESVEKDGQSLVRYFYDANGSITEKRTADGTVTEFSYDANENLTVVENKNQVTSRYEYVYDEEGNVISLVQDGMCWDIICDEQGQMTGFISETGDRTDIEYLANGARSAVSNNSETIEYTTNEMGQTTQVDDSIRTYDVEGNLLSATSPDSVTEYHWNDNGQLVGIDMSDGTRFEYGYDVFGNRSQVTVNGETTHYIWIPLQVPQLIGAVLPDGSYVSYIQGYGLEAQEINGELYFYQYDVPGSVVSVTNQQGDTVNSYRYSPDGQVISKDVSVANPFEYMGFYGIITDENGLWFMRSRYVDPETMSFISPDPMDQWYDFNLYRYAENNPVVNVDVNGKASNPSRAIFRTRTYDRNSRQLVNTKYNKALPRTERNLFNLINEGGPKYTVKFPKIKIGGEPAGGAELLLAAEDFINYDLPGILAAMWNQEVYERYQKLHPEATGSGPVMGRQIGAHFNTSDNTWYFYDEYGNFDHAAIQHASTWGGGIYWEYTRIWPTVEDTVNAPEGWIYIAPARDYSSPGMWIRYSIDPSGYVYEGVDRDRLEGVNATLLFKQDMDASDEQAVVWDAEAYDQANPQQTDYNGEYGWMVPTGSYKVVFEKEGYTTTETDWLPVPPVQTEVNISMNYGQAPMLENTIAYDDGTVMISFDRRVMTDSLNNGNILLTYDEGESIDFETVCLDPAYLEGAGMCGRQFLLNTYGGMPTTGVITLKVEGGMGYNNLEVPPYEGSLSIVRRVCAVQVPEPMTVTVGDTFDIPVTILDSTGCPVASQPLLAVPTSEALQLSKEQLFTDESGQAVFHAQSASIGYYVVCIDCGQNGSKGTVEITVEPKPTDLDAYNQTSANGRAWLNDLTITWTDGEPEDNAIVDRYVSAFVEENDTIRGIINDCKTEDILNANEQLIAWEDAIRNILYANINRNISAEDMKQIGEILYQRGRLVYQLTAVDMYSEAK